MKDKTALRRTATGAGILIVLLGLGMLIARCSRPATLQTPVDPSVDINAAAAGIDAIALWDSPTSRRPLLLSLRVNPVDPQARVVTARLEGGEVVQIAVEADPRTGRWTAQSRPQPAPVPDGADRFLAEPMDNGGARSDDPDFDAFSAAWRWLQAHLTGDTTLSGILASPRFSPHPPSVTYTDVAIDGATLPIEFASLGISVFGIDYRTVDEDGRQRSWRSWVAVRDSAGEWIVEGVYAVQPVPAAAP